MHLCDLRIIEHSKKVDASMAEVVEKINTVNTQGIVDGYSRQQLGLCCFNVTCPANERLTAKAPRSTGRLVQRISPAVPCA